MTLHVDLIENDLFAKVQRRVAVFVLNGADVRVDGPQASVWREKLLHPIKQPLTGELLEPDSAPKDWLDALPRHVHGSYLLAIGPHDEAECDFPGSNVVPMQEVKVPSQPFHLG